MIRCRSAEKGLAILHFGKDCRASSMSGQWKSNVPVSPSNMELPKKKNGEVDWHTLGNILVAHSLGEVVCGSYVDSIFGKSQEGLVPATDWKYAYEEKGVVVLVKELPDSPLKCFMGRSVIDLPPKVIHECVSVNENCLHWDKYAVEARLVESFREEEDVHDEISYLRCEARQCLVKSQRDFLFYVRNQHMADSGKRVISVLSVDYQNFPPVPGISRGQLCLGSGWVLEPYNGDPSRTLVSYLVHANLVGLPSLLINRAMQRQPLNIHYLQRHLIKPKEPAPSRFSFFSRPKTSSTVSTTSPDCSLITPEIPTPDVFHDETGYTFSAVTLGSNPLYNWSIGSTATAKSNATAKDKNVSLSEDEAEDKQLEEGESILDFRITSMDGGDRKARPGYLWLPSLRNLKPDQSMPKVGQKVEPPGIEEDVSPPSSGCEENCKQQHVHTSTGAWHDHRRMIVSDIN